MTPAVVTTDDAIEVDVTYPHPIDRVWRALTDPGLLARWLMPADGFRPEPGRSFTLSVSDPSGWNGTIACRILEVDPPRRLVHTWQGDPGTPETVVSYTLEPVPGGTRLRLVQSGFGPGGAWLRDILAGGWGPKLDPALAGRPLDHAFEPLVAVLDRLAEQEG